MNTTLDEVTNEILKIINTSRPQKIFAMEYFFNRLIMKKLILLATFHLLLHTAEQQLTLPDLLKQYPEQALYDLVEWKQRYRQKYCPYEYEPLKSQLASIAPCLMQQIKDQQWDEIFKDYNPQGYDQKVPHMNLVTTVAQKINHTQLLKEIKKRIGRNLHLAGRYGFVALINELSSPITIDSRDNYGRTALYLACHREHAKAVRALLAANATVDLLDEDESTPLIVAAQYGQKIKCCLLLLEAGATVNVQNYRGYTALYYAIKENKSDMVQLLLTYHANFNLVEAWYGRTPLMVATKKGHVACIQHLIKAGADVNARGRHGITALYLAVEENKSDMVQLLLTYNADPDLAQMEGITPLMHAAFLGHYDCVLKLIQAGAKVNFQNRYGFIALYYAARENKSDVVQLLLDYKADANIADHHGYTPLMTAVFYEHYECAQKLVQAGADVNARNQYGHKILDLAKGEFVQLLIQAGAKKSSQKKSQLKRSFSEL